MSTQPKFEPGQRVKVIGNGDYIAYHDFPIGQEVKIVKKRTDRETESYFCKNDKGLEQTVFANDLQPLNHE